MSSPRQRMLDIVLVWLVVAQLSGCALAPAKEIPSQTGRVLDEATQQPIEGAIVVLRWQGVGNKTFVDTQTVCYHVESAVSDAEGRYATTPWKEETRYRDLSMKQVLETVYKPGYRQVRVVKATGNQYLKQDTGTGKERLEYLVSLMRSENCYGSGDLRRNAYPLYKTIYQEAKSLSAEEKILMQIRRKAASVWLAQDRSKSQAEHDRAVSEFLMENLR